MHYTLIGELPQQKYVYVDSAFTHTTPQGFVPCVWFGLVSYPGRVWGCNILFASGAIYRNVPIHALAWTQSPEREWTPQDAQMWDCYDDTFTILKYSFLDGVRCVVKTSGTDERRGIYWLTVAPLYDGWSATPDQTKEFSFIALDNGRLTVQPTNRLLVLDRSFVKQHEWPKALKLQTDIYSCES